jgi:hypothetical protein
MGWRVIDDWPDQIPVAAGELDVFEAWFGDILDQLFGAETAASSASCAACGDRERK